MHLIRTFWTEIKSSLMNWKIEQWLEEKNLIHRLRLAIQKNI